MKEPLKYGVEIPLNSEVHRNALAKLRLCVQMSRRRMEERHRAWTLNENLFRCYVKENSEDAKRRQARDSGLPAYTTIVIPYSYAVVMTALTYLAGVFLGRNPIFQFTGRNPEAEESVLAVESVHEYQMTVGQNKAALYVWLMDMAKYGFGVVCDYWDENVGYVSRIVDEPRKWLDMEIPFTNRRSVKNEPVVNYRGNKLFNVRPFDFLPDPRVSMLDFQRGEFCGRWMRLQAHEIRAKVARGEFFNVEGLESNAYEVPSNEGSPANMMPGDSAGSLGQGSYAAYEIVLNCMPEAFGLKFEGADRPQKWVFTVVNDAVIVGARPQEADHNKFPYAIAQYDINGYELASFGLLDVTRPLNNVIDWLFNTHFFAVRRSLNGNIIVDPSRIVMPDLLNPNPGRVVRLAPSAYGSDPKAVWAEMTTSEPTQSHLASLGILDQIFQRVTGVSDPMQGVMSRGRKTAQEVRVAANGGSSRLKLHADWISATGFEPLAMMMLMNTQQQYNWIETFRASGQLAGSRKFIEVSPKHMQGNFDFVPVDGAMPADRTAQAALWKELMSVMLSTPALSAGYDIHAMFGYVAQVAGVNNLDQFRVEVTPDRMAMMMLKSGQAAPVGEAGALPQGDGYNGDSPSAAVPLQ